MTTREQGRAIEALLDQQDEEEANLQGLIDNGMAWRLEGSIGRAAMRAIEDGRCILGPEGHTNYWGSYVPARDEIVPGSIGSIEYAIDCQNRTEVN